MHLWSAFLSFIFIIYSVKKGKSFGFYWTSADLYIILNTSYLPLDIFVIMGLNSVMEFMLFWGIGGYGPRFLVLWVIENQISPLVVPQRTVWPKNTGLESRGWGLLVWLSHSLAKRKFISGLVKEGRWLWIRIHKRPAIYMLMFLPKDVLHSYNHEHD